MKEIQEIQKLISLSPNPQQLCFEFIQNEAPRAATMLIEAMKYLTVDEAVSRMEESLRRGFKQFMPLFESAIQYVGQKIEAGRL